MSWLDEREEVFSGNIKYVWHRVTVNQRVPNHFSGLLSEKNFFPLNKYPSSYHLSIFFSKNQSQYHPCELNTTLQKLKTTYKMQYKYNLYISIFSYYSVQFMVLIWKPVEILSNWSILKIKFDRQALAINEWRPKSSVLIGRRSKRYAYHWKSFEK